MKKKRGKFLTIMLFIMTILTTMTLYGSAADFSVLYHSAPSWLPTLIPLIAILDIVMLIGIWMWKKIAVYLYIASTAWSILSDALILKPTDEGLGYIFFGLIIIGLFFMSISRQWSKFK